MNNSVTIYVEYDGSWYVTEAEIVCSAESDTTDWLAVI